MGYYVTATDTTITFHVSAVDGRKFYRLYWRLASAAKATTKDFSTTEDFTYTVTGLTPETDYAVNVAHWETSIEVDGENNYILMGTQSIMTEASARPSNWAWTTNVAKGATVPKYGESLAPITAAEWNAFCVRINAFREYKSLSAYSFTTVSRGTDMTAAIINQAVAAITSIPGHGTLPTSSNAISAAFWQQLAAALNAIS